MPALLEDYQTLEDLAAEVSVSVRTIQRWTKTTVPALAVTYVGRRPLVARRDFEAWLAARRVQRNTRRGR